MAKLPALPYIRRGVTEGLSANASYREFQAAAHAEGLTGIRRQDYLRMYAQTIASRATLSQALSHPKTDLPTPDMIKPRRSTVKRGYLSWVQIYTRPTGGAGLDEQRWAIRSDEPLTPEEAERRAGMAIAQNPYDYETTIVGIGYIGTQELSPDF